MSKPVRILALLIAGVGSLLLTIITIRPPMIPADWARVDTNGIYIPPQVNDDWTGYPLQVGLWALMMASLWLAAKGKDNAKARRDEENYRLACRDTPWRVPTQHPRILFAVALLTLLGFALRVYTLQRLPLIIDESGFAAHASDILHRQQVPIFAPGHNGNPSVYSWLVALAMSLWGQNRLAMRLIPLFFGTMSIPAAYFLGRTWYSQRVGVIAAAFVTTFPAHVFFSRMTLYDIVEPFFTTLALAWLVRALRGGKPRDFVLAGMMAAGAQYFYHGARLGLALMAAYILLELRLDRTRWRRYGSGLGWLALTVGLMALPEVVTLVHFGLPISGNLQPLRLPADLAHNSLRAALAWVGQPDVSPFWLGDAPLLPLFALIGFALGLFVVIRCWRDPRSVVLLLSLVVTTIFGGAILTAAPLYVRYLMAAPAMALLLGLGIESLFHARSALWRYTGVALIVFVVLQGALLAVHHVDEAYARITPSQWQEDRLAQRAARLPSGTSLVLVVPADFGMIQRMTIAHSIAAYGERRALALNLSQPERIDEQRRRLPAPTAILYAS
jgi:4-amino-4-deoxy-L-arabinose transferase-like glycosyltransferase